MILRFMNFIDSGDYDFSCSVFLYMALHVMTFTGIFIVNAQMHAENSNTFNKYNRTQVLISLPVEIMIIASASCSYLFVIIKFMQCLLGVWIINYTIFFLYLAKFIFRCKTLGFKLHPEIILDQGSPEHYNLTNRILLAITIIWFLTLEYTIKIDTNWPKMIYDNWIYRPFKSVFGKMKDIIEIDTEERNKNRIENQEIST